ncbi:hypothetical protein D3C77_687730 [compost metagenome]
MKSPRTATNAKKACSDYADGRKTWRRLKPSYANEKYSQFLFALDAHAAVGQADGLDGEQGRQRIEQRIGVFDIQIARDPIAAQGRISEQDFSRAIE